MFIVDVGLLNILSTEGGDNPNINQMFIPKKKNELKVVIGNSRLGLRSYEYEAHLFLYSPLIPELVVFKLLFDLYRAHQPIWSLLVLVEEDGEERNGEKWVVA